MPITTKTVYVTSNGDQFDDKRVAEVHERLTPLIEFFRWAQRRGPFEPEDLAHLCDARSSDFKSIVEKL